MISEIQGYGVDPVVVLTHGIFSVVVPPCLCGPLWAGCCGGEGVLGANRGTLIINLSEIEMRSSVRYMSGLTEKTSNPS